MFKLLLTLLMLGSYFAGFGTLSKAASSQFNAALAMPFASMLFIHGTLCLIGLAIICHIDNAAEKEKFTRVGVDPQPTQRQEPTISED